MPRGRARRRNISDSPNTSRASIRSTSRPTLTSSPHSALRRSTRIAERSSSTREIPTPTSTENMAFVARRTQTNDSLGPRRVRAGLESEGMRTLNSRARDPALRQQPIGRVDGNSAEARSGYAMDVTVQPPSNARLGQALRTPVTVRLRRIASYAQDSDMAESGRLMAVAALVTPGAGDSDVPVPAGILGGPQMVDSIHHPSEFGSAYDADGDVVGYATFPELVISREGTYKIRIALIKVSGHGETTQAVDSRLFVVRRS